MRPAPLPVLLLAISCKADPDPVEASWEGRNSGECSDDADNDGDGAFDCFDTDCAGAADCMDDGGGDDGGDEGGDDGGADSGDTADPEEELAAARAEAWEELVDHAQNWLDFYNVPGMAFAVVLDGELAYAKALGFNQYGGSSPVSTETSWRWNSVSKFHAAIGLVQAAEAGLVDLDASVRDVDPGIQLGSGYDTDSLTVHRAMTHTTALPDWWDTSCDTTLSEHWAGARWNLHAQNSDFYNYSNTGWSLAGHILEQSTGTDFVDYMQDEVLDAVGMETATFDVDRAVEGSYTIGTDGSDFYTPDLHDCGWLRPAGWLHGSVLDLARMAEALLAGGEGLVEGDAISTLTDHVLTYWSPNATYGYGLARWNFRGVDVVSHSGSGGGHRSFFLMVPEADFAVVIATNTTWWNPGTVAAEAMELFVETPQDTDDALVTPSSEWSQFTGTFYDPLYYGTLVVSQDSGDRLYIRFADGSDVDRRLYQESTQSFFYVYDGYYNYMRFVPDEDGEITWLVNRYFVGTLTDESTVAPRPRDEIIAAEAGLGQQEPRIPGWPGED